LEQRSHRTLERTIAPSKPQQRDVVSQRDTPHGLAGRIGQFACGLDNKGAKSLANPVPQHPLADLLPALLSKGDQQLFLSLQVMQRTAFAIESRDELIFVHTIDC